MENWRRQMDLSHPVWTDYRERLRSLGDDAFPSPEELTLHLRPGLSSHGRKPIHFVPAGNLPGVEYEKHIFDTGAVSTREANWHDLFNALAWCRFPLLKVAMNAVHFSRLDSAADGRRGKQRDALTLFDECGVIVCSNREGHLRAIARHDWSHIFQDSDDIWEEEIRVFVIGHALLEKFMNPYKSITAHALLLCVDQALQAQSREALIPALDEWTADGLVSGKLLHSPGCLSPLPLTGIPGWWARGEQDDHFYADHCVFRPISEDFGLAPIFEFRSEPCPRM